MLQLVLTLAIGAAPGPDRCPECRTSAELLEVVRARRRLLESSTPSTSRPDALAMTRAEAALGGERGVRAWFRVMLDETNRAPRSLLYRFLALDAKNHDAVCFLVETARTFVALQRLDTASAQPCPPNEHYCGYPHLSQFALSLLGQAERLAVTHDVFGPCRDFAQDALVFRDGTEERHPRPLFEGAAFRVCGFRGVEPGSPTCAPLPLVSRTWTHVPAPNPMARALFWD